MRTRMMHQTTHSNATLILFTAIAVVTNVFTLQLVNVRYVNAFLNVRQPQQPVHTIASSSYFSQLSPIILQQQKLNDRNEDDDVFLTPIQIRTIRKDIIRKRANQKLPTIYYNNNNEESSSSTIRDNIETSSDNDSRRSELSVEQQIINALISDQLVQVRGIALQDTDTRTIRNEAEQLAYRIQKQIQQQQLRQQQDTSISSKSSLAYVFFVEMKGHMATLFYYIPQQQLTTPFRRQHQKTTTAVLSSSSSSGSTAGTSSRLPKVQLRTTGKRNDWNKRPKALRDNAGQIIK